MLNMKIAVFEYYHFQYALTMAEIFEGNDITYYLSQRMYDSLKKYTGNLPKGDFIINEEEEIGNNALKFASGVNDGGFDLVIINPIFKYFLEFNMLVQNLKPDVMITIHNLNTWFKPGFHGPKSYKEMQAKRKIANKAKYIAVEDFLYKYCTTEKPKYYVPGKFIYIPFTLYSKDMKNRVKRIEDKKIKVVLPGSIDINRRNYEDVCSVIKNFANEGKSICFAFAGAALGEYGKEIIEELKKANTIAPGIARFFEERPKPDEFHYEMASADIVLSTSNKTFKGFGVTEYIGKTKPTAAIHDMMTYELPGILPKHLSIPNNLVSSTIHYYGKTELYSIINSLYNNEKKIKDLKEQAKNNSKKFSVENIRNGLNFFKD